MHNKITNEGRHITLSGYYHLNTARNAMIIKILILTSGFWISAKYQRTNRYPVSSSGRYQSETTDSEYSISLVT